MTPEEEYALRQEKSRLQEQVRTQQELLDRQAEQIAQLSAQVADLQARLSKDSHNSHLPPCSGYLKHPSKKEGLISSVIPRIDPYSVIKRNYEVTECTTLFSVTECAKLRQEN